jgi:hypothetical protein
LAGRSGIHSIGVKLCGAIEWLIFGHFAPVLIDERNEIRALRLCSHHRAFADR